MFNELTENDRRWLFDAIEWANECHYNQVRKYSGLPYIIHPMRVMGEVAFYTNNIDVLMAAVLHDIIEDCGITYEQIKLFLGETTANLVQELTNPSKGSKEPREIRKAMDREHIKQASYWAKVIKAIDRTDNLRDMYSAPKDFLKKYCYESNLLVGVLYEVPSPIFNALLSEIEKLKRHLGE